jgi:hypothetical protein
VFTADDLTFLTAIVSDAWLSAADLDWSVPAGTLDWSCLHTADHAVDCVWAPVFFLAAHRTDTYPAAGSNMELGDDATPESLVESLQMATRVLSALVRDTDPSVRSILFDRLGAIGEPADFVPRAGLELVLHAHDVCDGLGVSFRPPSDLCARLRDHTKEWPVWPYLGDGLHLSDDAWHDLLRASGRR